MGNEKVDISTIPLANTLTGATMLGIAEGGETKRFNIDLLVRSKKGIAFPSTIPDGVRFLGETWPVDTDSYGSTFTGFGNINVPKQVGDLYVSNARFVYNNGAWGLQRELVAVSAINKTQDWVAKAYAIGNQVYRNGGIWEAVIATTAIQEPSVAAITIWKPITLTKTDLPTLQPLLPDLMPFSLDDADYYVNKAISTTSEIITGIYGLSKPYDVLPGAKILMKSSSSATYSNAVGLYDRSMNPIGVRLASGNVIVSSPTEYTVPIGVYKVVFYNRNISTNLKYPVLISVTFPPSKVVINGFSIDVESFKKASDLINSNVPLLGDMEQQYTNYATSATVPDKVIGADSVIGTGTYGISDYIPTNGAKKVFARSTNGARISGVFGIYDINKAPINPRLSIGGTGLTVGLVSLDIPDGVAYVTTYLLNQTSSERYPVEIGFDNERKLVGIKIENGTPIKIFNPGYITAPANRVINFQVPVNCSIPNVTNQNLDTQDSVNEHKDWGILQLPPNYSASGKPVKLIIGCHGTGTWISGTNTTQTASDFWLSQGYALLDMNGIPASFDNPAWNPAAPSYADNGNRHYGAPFALQSYLKGYNYAIENYNIEKNGCFVFGISMGGLVSNMLVQSGCIPVIAQAGFAPCLDHYKQAYIDPWNNGIVQRAKIASYFGFEGAVPAYTNTKPATQAERDYYIANMYKVLGYSPILKNVPMVGVNPATGIYKTVPINTSTLQPEEALDYDSFCKLHPVPFKIWHNLDDPTVKYRYSKYFTEMAKRAGALVELRTFTTGAHNAWLNGDVVNNIPTVSDGTISIETSMYECYLWFKRFE